MPLWQGVGFYELVPDATLFEARLKQRERALTGGEQPLGELCPVVRLHTLYRERKGGKHMLQKHRRCMGSMFSESLNIAESGVFVNDCFTG